MKLLDVVEKRQKKLWEKLWINFSKRTEHMKKGSDEYVKELNIWRIKTRKLNSRYQFLLNIYAKFGWGVLRSE